MPATAPDWPGRGAGDEEEGEGGRGGVANPWRGSQPAAATAGAVHVAARPGLCSVHPAWVRRVGGRREAQLLNHPDKRKNNLKQIMPLCKDDVLYIDFFFCIPNS